MPDVEPAPLAPQHRSLLALHGAAGVLVGLLGGLGFLFNILRFIEIFPFVPRIQKQVPGTEAAWRAAHTGPIMNGGERGLTPRGGPLNNVAYFAFLTAGISALVAVPLMIIGLRRHRRAETASPTANEGATDPDPVPYPDRQSPRPHPRNLQATDEGETGR